MELPGLLEKTIGLITVIAVVGGLIIYIAKHIYMAIKQKQADKEE